MQYQRNEAFEILIPEFFAPLTSFNLARQFLPPQEKVVSIGEALDRELDTIANPPSDGCD